MLPKEDKIIIIKELFDLIKENSSIITDKLSSVEVSNFDVVRVALRNELSPVVSKIVMALNSLEKFPKDLSINNLKDLSEKLDTVNDSIKNIKTEINVSSPEIPPITIPDIIVPDIVIPKIPEIRLPDITLPEIKLPDLSQEIDFKPVIDALKFNLEKLRKNSVNRPMAVRLSDGEKWIDKITAELGKVQTAISGYSDMIRLRNNKNKIINPATEDTLSSLLSSYNNRPRSAFGELLVVHPSPIFQGSFEYTVSNTDIISTTVVNGGTVTQSNAMAVVSTSTTTGSTAELETEAHAKYRAGQGGALEFTSLCASPVAGTKQLQGLADERGSSQAYKNGYMIGYEGTTYGFHRYQNDTLTTVAQSDWDDPMDGTGSSGMTLVHTNLNVFKIQFQYLGAGAIKLFIENDLTGEFVLVHTILYSNKFTVPSVYNPNFHFHMFADNGATTSNMTIQSASYAYFVEGMAGFTEVHQPQNSSGVVQKTSVTTETAIFTIRNRATYFSKNNFLDVVLENVFASVEASNANNLSSIRLIKNTTLGGSPSWSDINTNNSIVEIDTAGTTVTGGTTILNIPLAGKNDKGIEKLIEYQIFLRQGESITVAGSSAGSATIEAGILWKELF